MLSILVNGHTPGEVKVPNHISTSETATALGRLERTSTKQVSCAGKKDPVPSNPLCTVFEKLPSIGQPIKLQQSLCYEHFQKFNIDPRTLNQCKLQPPKVGGTSGKTENVETDKWNPAVTELFQREREKSRTQCCGKDQECHKTFKKTNLEFCDYRDGPGCHSKVGFSTPEIVKIWNKIYSQYFLKRKAGKDPRLKEIEKIVKLRNASGTTAEAFALAISELPAALTQYPVPPKVTLRLGPHVLPSGDLHVSGVLRTITHEFVHVCDVIKTQQKALKGEENPQKALGAISNLREATLDEKTCEVSPALLSYFRDLMESYGEPRELADCLKSIAYEKSSYPCKQRCKASWLMEGVAIALPIIQVSIGTIPSAYPLSCFTDQRPTHPFGMKVFDCVTKHSSRFRENFRKTFGCQAPGTI